MAYTNPTVDDFKAFFARDFVYGNTDATVMDSDIVRAEGEMELSINPNLLNNQATYTNAALYLSAHYLVMNLRAASQGLTGSYPWMTQSKSVGNVSESFAIPQRLLDNPEFAALVKTYYGERYLEIILPLLSGQMFSVCGRTNP